MSLVTKSRQRIVESNSAVRDMQTKLQQMSDSVVHLRKRIHNLEHSVEADTFNKNMLGGRLQRVEEELRRLKQTIANTFDHAAHNNTLAVENNRLTLQNTELLNQLYAALQQLKQEIDTLKATPFRIP